MIRSIVLVTDAWPPNQSGVVTWVHKTTEILGSRGFKVTILHPALFPSVSVPFYPEIHVPLLPYHKLKRLLFEAQPDAVHIVTEGSLGLTARRICLQYGIPYTSAYHSHFPLYLERRFGRAFYHLTYSYLRWFHKKSRAVFVSTPNLRKELLDHGFTNVVITPLGVDVELFKKNPSPTISTPAKPIFVYSGRLAVEKNVDDFLRLDLPGTKIVIGDGPERRRLEHQYTHAQFLGHKTQKEVADWLSLADVFVFPSVTDTFGLVILEALACEVPVAAYPVMGPEDIITNGIDGVLNTNLEKAAKDALKIPRENCRKKALAFSWEKGTDVFLQNLKEIPKP